MFSWSFTRRSMSWFSGVSLFLRDVRMRFWAENPLSQPAVCTGHERARWASWIMLGKSSAWNCPMSLHSLAMLSLGYFCAKRSQGSQYRNGKYYETEISEDSKIVSREGTLMKQFDCKSGARDHNTDLQKGAHTACSGLFLFRFSIYLTKNAYTCADPIVKSSAHWADQTDDLSAIFSIVRRIADGRRQTTSLRLCTAAF